MRYARPIAVKYNAVSWGTPDVADRKQRDNRQHKADRCDDDRGRKDEQKR
jgi:hypothetical protein